MFIVFMLGSNFFLSATHDAKAKETLYYLHKDHQGSVVAFTENSSNVVGQNRYLPYGGDVTTSGQDTSIEKKYTSQIKDEKSDLYYYNARYYDPKLSNFLSPDRDGSQQNRYIYVGGDPINRTDPTGNRFVQGGGGGKPPPDPVDLPQIQASGVVGAQTIPTWQGPPGSNPYSGTPDPKGYLRTLAVAAGPAAIAPAAGVCIGNPALCLGLGFEVLADLGTLGTVSDAITCLFGDPVECGEAFVQPSPLYIHNGPYPIKLDYDADVVLKRTIMNVVGSVSESGDDMERIIETTKKVNRMYGYYGLAPLSTERNFANTADTGRFTLLGDLISNKCANCFVQSGVLSESLNVMGIDHEWIAMNFSNADHDAVRFNLGNTVYIADPTNGFVAEWWEAMRIYSEFGKLQSQHIITSSK